MKKKDDKTDLEKLDDFAVVFFMMPLLIPASIIALVVIEFIKTYILK